jgi:hypothetical protein
VPLARRSSAPCEKPLTCLSSRCRRDSWTSCTPRHPPPHPAARPDTPCLPPTHLPLQRRQVLRQRLIPPPGAAPLQGRLGGGASWGGGGAVAVAALLLGDGGLHLRPALPRRLQLARDRVRCAAVGGEEEGEPSGRSSSRPVNLSPASSASTAARTSGRSFRSHPALAPPPSPSLRSGGRRGPRGGAST